MVTAITQESLKDLSGEVLKDGSGKPITNGIIFVNALLAPALGDEKLSEAEKLKRFTLAQRIFKEPVSIDLTSEEVVLLRDLVNKNYGVLVTGQILEWLK